MNQINPSLVGVTLEFVLSFGYTPAGYHGQLVTAVFPCVLLSA